MAAWTHSVIKALINLTLLCPGEKKTPGESQLKVKRFSGGINCRVIRLSLRDLSGNGVSNARFHGNGAAGSYEPAMRRFLLT